MVVRIMEILEKNIKNPRAFSKYRLWGNKGFMHICLESPGCRFRKEGYCIMCDYGNGNLLTPVQVADAMKDAFQKWGQPVHLLLVGSCGSVFDEQEITFESLQALLNVIAETNVEAVIFETHYSTVREELLAYIRKALSEKKLSIELGFESSNPEILVHHLHKYVDLNCLLEKIAMIKRNGMGVILNVFLGSPGLNSVEQMLDSLHSIRWAFEHDADEVVVFPSNIKPKTRLWDLYESGEYQRPSSWLLVKLLSNLTAEELSKTSISWFGDRQYAGLDEDILPPATCPECRDLLMKLFRDYMDDPSGNRRMDLLKAAKESATCNCYKDLS